MKPLTKNQKIGIGAAIAAAIAIAGGLIYSWKNKMLFWKEDKADLFTEDAEAQKEAEKVAHTTGRPKITWRNDSFPLSIGSKGQNVKNLQKYLSIKDDGYFGYDTLDAWKKKSGGKDKVLSANEYTPKTTTTSSSSEPYPLRTKVYAKKNASVFYNPGSDYILGHVPEFKVVGFYAGKSSVPSYSRVEMPGYYDYDNKQIIKRDTYFVLTSTITDIKP